ncbi:MAG: dihydrofolate reductase family protein [Salinivirgaceae bacterium]|jgi:dihydrofolate reductase|nr:dihydrofolate reductase family protein [Salinivirgaceae bacterium]
MNRIDALVMGRNTFEMVCSFGGDWPYNKPVFVMSTTLSNIPEKYTHKAQLVKGSINEIIQNLNQKGYKHLYIDGGKTIQSFLKEDLIDELIITTIPILLGGGSPLFGKLKNPLEFEYVKSEVFLDALVQDTYKRKR